jgi:hypothetical protein
LYDDIKQGWVKKKTVRKDSKERKTIRIAEDSLYRLWDKSDRKEIDRDTFLKGAGLRYFEYLEIE